MARKKHTPSRRPAVRTVAAAIALATAGIATAAWLTSAQEATRVTTIATTTATTTAAPATTASPTAAAAATASAQAQNETIAVNAARQTSTPSAPAAAGQRAFIDPATGQLRQPEHEELAAIAAEAAAAPARRTAARSAGAAAQMFGTDGSVSATVPEELHTFTVATRGPDGRIVIDHAQGRTNAARIVKANSAKNTRASVNGAQQKEDRHDR